MKHPKLIMAMCLTVISAGLFSFLTNAQQTDSFNNTQKEEINALIRDYILTNPEIIPEAVEVLRSRQSANALSQSDELLYNDGYSFVAGNADADVTIVEFYDYNCGYCKQVPEVFAKLLEEDDDVRIIFKELPILAESSEFAAIAAMASMKQNKFLDFHSALMKNKRALTEDLILQIARDSGVDEALLIKDMADPEIESNIMKTKYLVQVLGISGTPGFVIGDQIIPGYISYDQLRDIVDKQRQS
ncbi:MAG: DsbA family protein [Kordiimonadaceae bacterium]|jgi:protein-disulfide isomerase|nr:DsbA family protein [Kordiimonadaceae bacterium]MBT6035208.1 DsbA family protein [Kordiimonadaceae bacterium]MBT6329677.1 DsbA family protein [Kordiimonadaceae bacterium]MBT7583204.1 DsbA family protein [Kordiimonadaceae bacterium]